MKKLLCVVAGICLVCFVAGSAIAGQPSAKFAATWSTVPALASVAVIPDTETISVGPRTGYTLATIKVPQDKELLVGVSAEIVLVTDTSVKGKEGGAAKAIAGAEAYVTVIAVPRDGGDSQTAEPGLIMLSKRVQELDATLGGVLEGAVDTGTWTLNSETGLCEEILFDNCVDLGVVEEGVSCKDGEITIPCELVLSDEEIGLMLDTTAAHHFNFVLPDMDQGVYDIKAVFTTGARAEVIIVDNCEDGDCISGSAYATAIINKTMVTVQQVRAVKDSLEGMEIIEIIEP